THPLEQGRLPPGRDRAEHGLHIGVVQVGGNVGAASPPPCRARDTRRVRDRGTNDRAPNTVLVVERSAGRRAGARAREHTEHLRVNAAEAGFHEPALALPLLLADELLLVGAHAPRVTRPPLTELGLRRLGPLRCALDDPVARCFLGRLALGATGRNRLVDALRLAARITHAGAMHVAAAADARTDLLPALGDREVLERAPLRPTARGPANQHGCAERSHSAARCSAQAILVVQCSTRSRADTRARDSRDQARVGGPRATPRTGRSRLTIHAVSNREILVAPLVLDEAEPLVKPYETTARRGAMHVVGMPRCQRDTKPVLVREPDDILHRRSTDATLPRSTRHLDHIEVQIAARRKIQTKPLQPVPLLNLARESLDRLAAAADSSEARPRPTAHGPANQRRATERERAARESTAHWILLVERRTGHSA